ncbi:MAG: signal peptidase I [Rhodospirillales bacterium]|nr:signal peptidase I [Rhodospirillales bacterium]
MSRKSSGGIAETFWTVIYAVVIALVVRTVAYEPFNIPSGSMIPTLLVGDYLFVSKFSYGYSKYSLPFSLPLIPGRIFFSEPERGDVFVFKLPKDNKTDYIKRIIGLPGDKIQVVGGILNINGKPVQRERVNDFIDKDDAGNRYPVTRYIETLPNGHRHEILEVSDVQPNDNTRVYTVPKGHYFAMGDNRDNSSDSRFSDVGYIPRVNLVGRAEFIFLSVDGALWKAWQWFWTLRTDRFFQGIK